MIARLAQSEIAPMIVIGMAEKQGARRGDDQHCQKANRLAADCPRHERHCEGYGRVNGPQLIAQSSQMRPLGLGLAHDFHDLGVARIGGALRRPHGQGRFAVDRARDHRRAACLCDFEWLAREIRFVHHRVALNHHAVGRTNLMRINHEDIAHGNLRQRHLLHFRTAFPVCNRRHPFDERGQNRRGAAQRISLQRFTAGKHQNNNRTGQILV